MEGQQPSGQGEHGPIISRSLLKAETWNTLTEKREYITCTTNAPMVLSMLTLE